MYRILITDDEKTERDCIRFLIQQTQLPLEIQEAEDGLSALHILKDWPADILFTDVQMPVMDGLEATRRIRSSENPLGKTIPILAMTANAFLEDMQKSKEAGMDEHLSKPVDIAMLEQVVRRFRITPPRR